MDLDGLGCLRINSGCADAAFLEVFPPDAPTDGGAGRGARERGTREQGKERVPL